MSLEVPLLLWGSLANLTVIVVWFCFIGFVEADINYHHNNHYNIHHNHYHHQTKITYCQGLVQQPH